MSKFRLKAARQKGEQIAKEYGFDQFPIDPFTIAEVEEIVVEAKPPEQEGVSGCIVFRDDGVGIIYSTHIRSEGFRRFTVAHELGHYFLDGHPEEIYKNQNVHVSKAGFTQGQSSIEIEADHFASGLLMPTHLVRKALEEVPVGLMGIQHLSAQAEASLTAAAIRTAECATYPLAIIVSQDDRISYCFMSDGFKAFGRLTFLRKGDPLPFTKTRTFNADQNNVKSCKTECDETTVFEWFGGSAHIKLDEEVIGLGNYGYTLTVLSSDILSKDTDDEEPAEDELIEAWTPKFTYGR